jgi:hypothetical protein
LMVPYFGTGPNGSGPELETPTHYPFNNNVAPR